jgi:hypothetical protein
MHDPNIGINRSVGVLLSKQIHITKLGKKKGASNLKPLFFID